MTKDGKLVGVVSRRDIESAIVGGHERDRVSRHMSHPVHTTEEDVPLDDALARMTAEDVGRIIVRRGGRVVGILTRQDVLEALYGDSVP